jgi:hypothetical protein
MSSSCYAKRCNEKHGVHTGQMGNQQCYESHIHTASVYITQCHSCSNDVIKSLQFGVAFGASSIDDESVYSHMISLMDSVHGRLEKIHTVQQRLEVLDHSGWLYRDWIRLMLDAKYEPQRALIAACRLELRREMFACDFDFKTAVKFRREYLNDREMFMEERVELENNQLQMANSIREDIRDNLPFWINKLTDLANQKKLKEAHVLLEEACHSSNFEHAVLLHQRKFKRMLMRCRYGSQDLSDGIELSNISNNDQDRFASADNNENSSLLLNAPVQFPEDFGSPMELSLQLSMPLTMVDVDTPDEHI